MDTTPETRPIDLEAALEYLDGDEGLFRELLPVFLDDCPRQLADLRGAAAAERPDELMAAAHGLKGALRVLGASTAADLAEGLEQMGREHRLEGLAERVEAFRRELEGVVRFAGELLRAGA